MSFAAFPCKGLSLFSDKFFRFCTYKISELRKPLLEAIQGKIFKTRGLTYLFPARGWKHFIIQRRYFFILYVSLTYSPQGDGNYMIPHTPCTVNFISLTYLFPARGWKHKIVRKAIYNHALSHLPIPRKGMETKLPVEP